MSSRCNFIRELEANAGRARGERGANVGRTRGERRARRKQRFLPDNGMGCRCYRGGERTVGEFTRYPTVAKMREQQLSRVDCPGAPRRKASGLRFAGTRTQRARIIVSRDRPRGRKNTGPAFRSHSKLATGIDAARSHRRIRSASLRLSDPPNRKFARVRRCRDDRKSTR